jgi:transposase-like protein
MAKPILTAAHFHNEEAAFAFVEAHLWPNGPVCPHCGNCDEKRIGRLTGKTSRPGMRKCYACRKTFTVRMGSIFESSHFPLHLWLQAIQLIAGSKKGISTRQIQRTFNCSMKTAWFLTHRIREIMKPANASEPPLGGDGKVIEADVTYVGRKPFKKARRGGGSNMNPVFSLIERNGAARSVHMPDVRAHNLGAALDNLASPKSTLMTDEAASFQELGWNFASHQSVNHSKDEYARREGDRVITTNAVEGFFSILKRGVYGVYQHVSEAHLHRYLYEFDFRYSTRERLGINDTDRASIALKGAKGRRLTYETTLFNGR